MLTQIAFYIKAIKLDIREYLSSTVLLALSHEGQIGPDPFDHLIRTHHKGVHVDDNAFVRPPATAFLHSTPVLERDADQGIWRDHRDGIVPIPHLDGVESDFLDGSVRAAVCHLYPVSDTHHIVLRQLHPGHKTQNAVLEDQHKHSSRCTQTCKENLWRLAYQNRNDKDSTNEEQGHLQTLKQGFERMITAPFTPADTVHQGHQNGIAYQYDD